jgi:4-diphosphocytidyl-2-C-methyl-D-erythritol kinase
MNAVRIEAPAKVNLRLVVLAREESGFHTLETLFCGIALADTLELIPGSSGVHLEVKGGVDTGPPEMNLVALAARRFHERLGAEPAVALRLEKRIPAAAGLGGGSSDAAATLLGLNQLHGAPFDRQTLLGLGADLGSDVPFFLTRTPFAMAWGRGERLLELAPPPERPVLVAHPGIASPTPEAFAALARIRERQPRPIESFATSAAELSAWTEIERLARNDLEAAVADRLPTSQTAMEILRQAGATLALLAGSGSSVFGVFPPGTHLDPAEARLRELGFATIRSTTLQSWPHRFTSPDDRS